MPAPGTPAKAKRRVPRRRDLAPLLRFKRPALSARTRRLEAALTIEDLREIARRRTPKAAFNYTEGAAEGEISLDNYPGVRKWIERIKALPGFVGMPGI